MKKILGFSLVLIAASTIFVACKKDYTCTCVYSPSGSTSTITITKTTKSIAKSNCVSTSQTENGVTYTNTCTLK